MGFFHSLKNSVWESCAGLPDHVPGSGDVQHFGRKDQCIAAHVAYADLLQHQKSPFLAELLVLWPTECAVLLVPLTLAQCCQSMRIS